MFFYKINGQRKFDKFGRGKILIYQLNPNLTKSGPLYDGLQTGATPLFICDGKQKWEMEVRSVGSMERLSSGFCTK